MEHKYRINIVWSEPDECYLVELPEFAHELQRYFTHGDTCYQRPRGLRTVT